MVYLQLQHQKVVLQNFKNADENDDMFDRYKLVSMLITTFRSLELSAGGGWESRVKFHSERGNIEPIYDPLGLHGGGVVIALLTVVVWKSRILQTLK